MKKIIVTGAAGFIGSRTVLELQKQGHSVVSVDALSHFNDRSELKVIPHTEKIDRDLLPAWLEKNTKQVQAVFHLGACTDTTELDENYLREINLEYSQKIWNFCTKNQVPLVYASSAATYGEGENGYADDESWIPKLKPLNPYGWSKQLFDLWVLDQEKKSQTPPQWSGFKFFNVYGWGERHKTKMSSVIVQAYDQILKTGKMKLFKSHKAGIADGEQKRDFILVEDVVSVLLHAYTHPIRRGIYNLGTGQARSFNDLTRTTFKALEMPEKLEYIDTPEVLRARYQYFTEAEMGKLRAQGYTRAFTPLEAGVALYVRQLKKGL